MPIFSKKFDIKNIPQRGKRDNSCAQIQEKLDDFHTIQLNLTNKRKLKFVDGTWIVTQQHGDADDITAMRKRLQKLEEENNLNQIKVDVLLDMLTENLAELKILRNK
ncbi:protein chibby homolog 1 [Contarinia nasturtii]|uniref:protein chibby homolog 1 n=1 Tax=Contarinia nasturtii TaxID=265458 RepID=UPI0012D43D7D|nr:protein chibby homolog 1 [Contarinia nasturtii]